MGTARTKASNKYRDKTYDRISVQVKKGQREELKNIAAQLNESLNAFIIESINQRIEKTNSLTAKWLSSIDNENHNTDLRED